MLRTLMLAGLVTLFGATASEAQYQDSYPPDDQYVSEYETESTYDPSYDYELLGPPQDRYRDDDDYDGDRYYNEPDVDVGIFFSLGDHGRWRMTASYGWVWTPYHHAGWRPYSAGRWVWTSYGWTWISYEPYGWATYHYGYWARDPYLGWVWIPGYEWAATRVQFAYYDNYISWAPMAPPGYYCPQPWSTAGISFWFTIGADNFCDPYPYRHCVTPVYQSHYKQVVAYKSPSRTYVERYTGTPVRETSVKFKNTSWSKGSATSARFETRGGTTKFNAKGGTTQFNTKSRASKSETRAFNTPSVRKNADRTVMKNSKPSRQLTREFRAPERSTSRQALKPQRETKSRETRALRADRPAKQQQQFTTRSGGGESKRIAKAEPRREQQRRSIEQPRREQRSSKALKVSRSAGSERKSAAVERRSSGNGGERKSVTTQRKSEDRKSVASKKSGGREGRGKAR